MTDGRPDFQATGSEWRTPPLWGIGLIETVNRHTMYLHDGRARNLMEAILWHGGEGEAAKTCAAIIRGRARGPDHLSKVIVILSIGIGVVAISLIFVWFYNEYEPIFNITTCAGLPK